MSNFTILMNENKYLINTTPNVNLFQGENYVDSFQILIPKIYGELDLRLSTVTFEYIDENSNSYIDILTADEEIYKDKYIRYVLPVTTIFTKSAGVIKATLSLNFVDKEGLLQHTLHTGCLEIMIHPKEDWYKFSDDSLNKIDKMIGQLSAKIDYIDNLVINTPDDLGFDEKGTLHITKDGIPLGNGADVATIEVPDEYDADKDGILDITGKYDDDPDIEPIPTPSVMSVDNHIINDKGQIILTSNGKQVGNALNVATVDVVDDDGTPDGIINLSGKYEDIEL